jgi:hypothetical protein
MTSVSLTLQCVSACCAYRRPCRFASVAWRGPLTDISIHPFNFFCVSHISPSAPASAQCTRIRPAHPPSAPASAQRIRPVHPPSASAQCIPPVHPPSASAQCIRPVHPPSASAQCIRPVYPRLHLYIAYILSNIKITCKKKAFLCVCVCVCVCVYAFFFKF